MWKRSCLLYLKNFRIKRGSVTYSAMEEVENVNCFELNNLNKDTIQRLEVHDRAYAICKEFMRGPWSTIPKNDLIVKVLGGGLTNKLYICKIPKYLRNSVDKNCPHTLVLRIYGLIIQDFKAQIQESVVFSILSERKIGPKLYAVFPGGRLEEYIPCRTLKTNDLPDPTTSRFIAKRMARYHQMVMPVQKEPTMMMDKLQLYLEGVQHVQFEDENKSHMLSKLLQCDLRKEVEYVKNIVMEMNSPVVFCHNDVQEGNLLDIGERSKHTNPIKMIDFEYSSYNYRGFDIGNHFCEWMYDYSHQKWPFFSCNSKDYPTRTQQVNFIQSYIEEQLLLSNVNTQDETLQVDFMIKEANRFALLSHIFWAMWSVVQAKMSDIGFGYMEYALARMEAYFIEKDAIE